MTIYERRLYFRELSRFPMISHYYALKTALIDKGQCSYVMTNPGKLKHMKAESLSFGITAIIKREEIRKSTDINYIHDNLKAKQNKKPKTGISYTVGYQSLSIITISQQNSKCIILFI